MASFDEGACTVRGGPEGVNGVFKLLKKSGKHGEKVYQSKTLRLFLYHIDAEGHYAIGRKKGGASCKAYNSSSEAEACGEWQCYIAKTWGPFPEMRFSDGLDDDPPAEVPSVASALAVSCRYGNISGGYARVADREESGKAVFRNDEDSKELWYGPTGCWMISDSAGLGDGGAYSSYMQSAVTSCVSPEEGDWSAMDVHMHRVAPPGAGAGEVLADESSCFQDPTFGAHAQSLGSQTECVWVRPLALAAQGEELFLFNGIEPNDVMQGSLGDCWLMSAIAAIAEFPSFIQSELFVTQALASDGKYTLRLYDAGKGDFVHVEVDDRIPCTPGTWWELPKPLYAQPRDNELYILLIEKAFAKFAGCYEKLSGGYPLLAWMAMTGCTDLQVHKRSAADFHGETKWTQSSVAMDKVKAAPSDFQKLFTRSANADKAGDEMFEFLQQCDADNFIMAASIGGDVMEKPRDDGLVELHAYSLIAVKQLSESGTRLVQARNPWGNDREWNGAWADDSPEWDAHPGSRQELNCEDKDDGLFWMCWDDFSQTFDSVQVCAIAMTAKRAAF